MGKKPPDASKGEPSLELPHFGLRGRGSKKKSSEQASAALQEEPADSEPTTPLLVQETQTPNPDEEALARRVAGVEGGRAAARRVRRDWFSLPAIPGVVAAVVTGLVVGAFGTGMTYLTMAGCEQVRGASTCGGSGLFLLVAILILMILLGAVMLRVAKVSDPGSTSFLAVSVLGVIALLTLTDVIFSGWMFLLVPIICGTSYALSHWVATKYVDEPDRPEGDHDLR